MKVKLVLLLDLLVVVVVLSCMHNHTLPGNNKRLQGIGMHTVHLDISSLTDHHLRRNEYAYAASHLILLMISMQRKWLKEQPKKVKQLNRRN